MEATKDDSREEELPRKRSLCRSEVREDAALVPLEEGREREYGCEELLKGMVPSWPATLDAAAYMGGTFTALGIGVVSARCGVCWL